jgi:hypothetical protein
MSNISYTKDILQEGKEFPIDVLKKIENLTDDNDHQAARILLAKTMRDKKLLSAYEGIKAIQDFYGHLPRELSQLRYDIDKKMFERVKKNYSNGQDVYMAF